MKSSDAQVPSERFCELSVLGVRRGDGNTYAFLLDLEPHGGGAGGVGRAGAGTLGKVRNDRALVGVGPSSPVQTDARSSRNRGGQGGRSRAGVQVTAALHIDGSEVLDRAVSGDLAEDPLRRHTVVGVRVGLVAGICDASDGCIVDVSVRRDAESVQEDAEAGEGKE